MKAGELLFEALIDRLINEDGRFARANHPVIEILREDDVVDSLVLVTRFVDVARHVARSDPKGRFAATIGRFDHGVPAGGQDGSNSRMIHEGVSGLHRRMFNPLNAIVRGARRHRRVSHDNSGRFGAFLGFRMETEDDRVSRFDGDE